MQTVKFNPDRKGIEERARIVPYGKADKQTLPETVQIDFCIQNSQEQQPVEPVGSGGIYRPSMCLNVNVASKLTMEVSVKVMNVPLVITQEQLAEAIQEKARAMECTKLFPRPFSRIYLVLDRETKKSRGYAYLNCENMEKAREVAKVVRTIVLDACALGAEVMTS